MISRRDTKRAVEILARYQGILRSPEEQPLHASIGKVVHVFQSELFQALLDIQECYELSLFSASKRDRTLDLEACTSWKPNNAGTRCSLDDEDHHKPALQEHATRMEARPQCITGQERTVILFHDNVSSAAPPLARAIICPK